MENSKLKENLNLYRIYLLNKDLEKLQIDLKYVIETLSIINENLCDIIEDFGGE